MKKPKNYSFMLLNLFLALLSGAMLVLAFAPFNWSYLAILCMIGLFLLCNTKQLLQTFFYGLIFGIGFFGFGVYWVFISIYEFGQAPIWLSALFTGLFILVLALFPAVLALVYHQLFFTKAQWRRILGFSSLWLLFEWLRSHLFTGFPWLLLGYSQVNTIFKNFIPVVGVYGTGWILIFTSLCFYQVFDCLANKREKQALSFILPVILVVAISLMLHDVKWTVPKKQNISFSLVQGNIPQQLKWEKTRADNIVKTYIRLTAANLHSDLIIWPEAALPYPLPQGKIITDELDEFAKQHKNNLLLGVIVQAPNQFYYFNSLQALGLAKGRYDKQRLVPFGEYVPLENLLRGIIYFFNLPMSYITPGASQQKLITIDHNRVGSFICYEIAYPQLLMKTLPDANFLVVVSNDAWFGDSIALAQHLEIAQARALQAGRELLFVANTGITAHIAADGNIITAAPPHQRFVLNGILKPYIGTTLWYWLGNKILLLIMAIIVVITLLPLNASGRQNT